MIEPLSFAEEIEANKGADKVRGEVATLRTEASELNVRLRGAYITKCELTSPTSGRTVAVLYSDSDLTKPKISATHAMVPAGPYDGIGGQHGFARWADYDAARQSDSEVTLTARRSDGGLGLSKRFVLDDSGLTTRTVIANPGETAERTSMGEHIYFAFKDENFDGLKINGKSLDDLLGEGSEQTVRSDGTCFFEFGSEAEIEFPAGHRIRLSAAFTGVSKYPLAMWIWKRPGSPSICFEPVVGVKGIGLKDNRGVTVQALQSAELCTRIELL